MNCCALPMRTSLCVNCCALPMRTSLCVNCCALPMRTSLCSNSRCDANALGNPPVCLAEPRDACRLAEGSIAQRKPAMQPRAQREPKAGSQRHVRVRLRFPVSQQRHHQYRVSKTRSAMRSPENLPQTLQIPLRISLCVHCDRRCDQKEGKL